MFIFKILQNLLFFTITIILLTSLYNYLFIKHFVKSNYPDDVTIKIIKKHPLVYLFPIFVVFITYHYIQIHEFLDLKASIIHLIALAILWICYFIIASFIFCITEKRIIIVSSIKFLNKFKDSVDLTFNDIKSIEMFSLGFSKEIVLKTTKGVHRLASISDIDSIYKTLQEKIRKE